MTKVVDVRERLQVCGERRVRISVWRTAPHLATTFVAGEGACCI